MFARWDRMAKQFSRISKEIIVAVKAGGPDPHSNPALRRAVQNARQINMPKDKVESAIKRAVGKDATNYEQIIYEGYAPHGVAVIVECATDNPTRTVASVRSIFGKHGGNLGESNSVSFMFDRVGEFRFPLSVGSADEVLEKAIDAGADDVVSGEGEGAVHEIYGAQDNFNGVREALEKSLGQPSMAKLSFRPKTTTPVEGETVQTLLDMIAALEDNDDVQNVYANFELSDDALAKFAA